MIMENEQFFRLFAHLSLLFSVAVMVVVLIYLRRHMHTTLQKTIYALLCFWALLEAKDIVYFFGDIWYNNQITNVLMSLDLWPMPIIIIILLNVVGRQWLNIGRIYAIALPFFLFTLLCIVTKGNAVVFLVNQIYAFVVVTIFCVVTLRFSFKYEAYIKANYSDADRTLDIVWLRALIILLYIICIVLSAIFINSTWLGDAIYYIINSAFYVTLFLFVVRERYAISIDKSLNVDEQPEITKWDSLLEERLEEAIHTDKIFLNPHLSLADLAARIGTNRTYLSRYINQYKSISFVSYINNFRLEEAQRLLDENNENNECNSIAEIAEMCGFSSASTFRRVFKLRYGHAPSIYSRREK